MRMWRLMVMLALIGLAGCERNRDPREQKPAEALDELTSGTPTQGSISHANVTRTLIYYIPEELPEGPIPLVFMLHGGGGWGEQVMNSTAERWNELADQHGFVVVYPDGLNHRWNDCRTDDRDPSGADDVGLINALIDSFSAKLPIDQQRIYVAGHSNGGMMAFRIGLELSNRVAAVFSASGNIARFSECPAPSPISVMYLIGTADPVMPFAGGPITIPLIRDQGEVLSAADTVAFWTNGLGLNEPPIITALPDLNTTDQSTVTLTHYTGGIDGAELRYYRVDGGGHSLPSSQTRPKNGPKNEDISAIDEAWDFFAPQRLIKR